MKTARIRNFRLLCRLAVIGLILIQPPCFVNALFFQKGPEPAKKVLYKNVCYADNLSTGLTPGGSLGDFSLSISPVVQMVSPGLSTNFSIVVEPTGGFSRPVALSALLTPPNNDISLSFLPDVVMPGNRSVLTVSTTLATIPGSYSITVTGVSDQIVHKMTVFIGVLVSDFKLSLNQEAKMVLRGEKGVIRVNIHRSASFNGAVTVFAPDTKLLKIKMTPPEQSTTGESVEFPFKIKAKAPLGMQQLTFVGQDDTGQSRSVTLMLLISKDPRRLD